MMVYKALPGGGYTAMPATDAKLARLQKQGWTTTQPALADAHDDLGTAAQPETAPVVEDAPKKRGRPRRESVN